MNQRMMQEFCLGLSELLSDRARLAEAAAEIERLRAAAEYATALRKDAERYRYMRSNAELQNRNGPGIYWYLPRWDRDLPIGERLDRAIDAQTQEPN